MNMKKLFLIALLAFGALMLSACTGSRSTVVNTWPGLAADGERAYLASGAHVYAVDVKTGKEAWRYPAEADKNVVFYANPAITPDGQLIIGSEGTNHELVSVDPATGKENWAAPFTGAKARWVAAPLIFNERIYAPNTDGYLYILDMNGKQAANPVELGGALWSTPVTDGTLIYVTSLDHHLHIIDPSSNAITATIDLGGASPSSPALGTDGVFAGSFAAAIEHVTSTGEHNVVSTTGDWIWGAPVIDNGNLYYADLGGNLYSLDLASGSQNWGAIKPDGPVVASMLVAGDQIYVATEAGTFLALDRDGKSVWEKQVGGQLYTTPVLSGDMILVAPYQADFALAAYDAEGKQAWTYSPAQ